MGSKSQSRNSSPPKSPTATSSHHRRPKLMRAAATEPSLATSHASRKDLASLHCPSHRAAVLLTRVASYSSNAVAAHPHPHEHEGEHDRGVAMRRNGSICSTPGGRSPESAGCGERKEPFEIVISQSGNYFSFPCFEDFEDYHLHHESEDRIDDRGHKDVP